MSSNIDDELLALAGGNDSSDEDEVASEVGHRAPSTSPPPEKSSGSTKTGTKKSKKTTDHDSDEEEGEEFATPGSPNSIGSAAMDESDSEAEEQRASTEPDETEKYPVDGMFVSLEEKEHVMSLREVERESLLADRSAEIERQRQNRMLRQLVTKQENEEKKMKLKKRTADAAELDDEQRRSTRSRTDTKTGAAIDSLRRARAEKYDRALAREERSRQDRRSPRPDRRSSSGSVASRDSFDHRRGSASPERRSPPRELPPPGLRDFERIRVGRSRFAQYCFNPGFDDAITGCYVRVSLGPDPKTGIDDYRMAKIKGFTLGRPYAMNGPGGSFVTDQYVLAAHGRAEKPFAFIFCSDKPFTEREFNRYVATFKVEELTLPKTEHLIEKIDDINRFVERSLTSAEIDEKVERKKALRAKFDPQRRERIRRDIEEAYALGKTERAKALEEELEELLANRLAFRTTLSPPRTASTGGTEQDRLADINRERRRQNAANVARAQLKEKAEARRREAALERGDLSEADVSRRIRTKAKFVHENRGNETGESQGASRSETPAKNGTPSAATPKNEPEVLPHLAKALEKARKGEQKKGIPSIHRPICDDDIIGQIDLELDVEIE